MSSPAGHARKPVLYSRRPGTAASLRTSVRRYSTVIAIGIAAALAAIIVIASGTRQDADDGAGRPNATSSTLPADHPNTAMSLQSGMVDTAAAQRSIAALERAHEANPGSIRITLNLGDAYFAAQRHDEAAAAYGEALAANPGHPSATVRMAMVWYVRGDDDRAIRLIERVLAVLPDNQEAHYDLAIIRFSHQEIAAAREAWVKAAEIDPTSGLGRASQNFVDLLSDGAGQDSTR
jgi:cytochrome c-type biogenesis protein CcmH/NrfG